MSSSIFEMDLHETFYAGSERAQADLIITRVSGGWIYTTVTQVAVSSCYVPLSSEFKEAIQ